MINLVKSISRPFAKYIYNRFRLQSSVRFGLSCDISRDSQCEGNNKFHKGSRFIGKIGFGSYVGPNSDISGIVGRFTSIGPDVKVIYGTHPYTYPFVTTCPYFYSVLKQNGTTLADQQYYEENLRISCTNINGAKIGSDCWIGERVLIVGGCSIGDGAVVLAGSVVTKNVDPYSIVGGVPAKHLRYRYNKEDIKFLLDLKWWRKDLAWLKTNYKALHNIDVLKNDRS